MRFAACNTGIFSFYTQITAVSSSIIQLNRKRIPYSVTYVHQHPLFCCTRLVAYVMAEENVNTENNKHITNNKREQALEKDEFVGVLLSDKELKELVIHKLVDGGHMAKGTTPNNTDTNHAATHQNPTVATGTGQPFLYSFHSSPFHFGDPFTHHQRLSPLQATLNPQLTYCPLWFRKLVGPTWFFTSTGPKGRGK